MLADEAPKRGGASSLRSRRSWLCGHRYVEAEEDMAPGEGEGGGEAGRAPEWEGRVGSPCLLGGLL